MTQDREETAAMRTVLVVVDTLNDFMHDVIGNPAAKRLYSAFTETDDHLRALENLRSHGRAWFEAAQAMG
jgi:nicotinamidase-related amidase